MPLLAGKLYDPAAAVQWPASGGAALGMTAMDTVNLRLSTTVPAKGIIGVRLAGVISGATTFSQYLLGVMEGATVRGRATPKAALAGTAAATTRMHVEAEFLITGLTPLAAITLDAAYGIEVFTAGSLLRAGGPDDLTTNTAWGGFAFELWDVS